MSGAKKGQTIIIKKVKKGHGGHHGGAWKVAYADFVTAMMAFFLLMWLLNMSSNEKRIKLSYYFKNFSIFASGGAGQNIAGETATSAIGQKGEGMERLASKSDRKNAGGLNVPETMDESVMEKLKIRIENEFGEELGEQVLVDRVEGGVRIQIVDHDGRSMFELGSAVPRPIARDIIRTIANGIKDFPNKLTVEGHTDSYGFKNGAYSNWELSSDRANATRRLLAEFGIPEERIGRVAGFANAEPLVPDVPMDPRNRRISIILLDPPRKGFAEREQKRLLDVEPEQLDSALERDKQP